jgi:hypothetical protein
VIEREELLAYQELVRQIPVADNVIEHAVRLVPAPDPIAMARRTSSTHTSAMAPDRAHRST